MIGPIGRPIRVTMSATPRIAPRIAARTLAGTKVASVSLSAPAGRPVSQKSLDWAVVAPAVSCLATGKSRSFPATVFREASAISILVPPHSECATRKPVDLRPDPEKRR